MHVFCVQDGVYQPYHDLLPYNDFSVTLSKAQLPSIRQILDNISDAEYVKLRQGLQKYWRAFVWPQSGGGEAYQYTIQSLLVRVQHRMAGLF
jgi:hypothetical protein